MCSVTSAATDETWRWDDELFWAVHPWATRVRVVSECACEQTVRMNCTCSNMSCEWVFCHHTPSVVGKFFSRPTETGLLIEKNKFNELSDREESQGIPTSRRPIVAAPICWRWRRRRRRQVSLRYFKESPACSRTDCIVIFFISFERVFFSLSYLLASRNGSTFLLGPCHVLVV